MPTVQSRQVVIDGRYAIERELERSGMSLVLVARDTRLGGLVAVKQLLPELAGVVGIERFRREIHVTAALHHPNLLPILDSGEHDGGFYYVSPFMEGGSLRDLLERERQLPVERALSIFRDVCAGLGHAHAHGIVHRDVKPENILLSGDRALVADFGIARAVAGADAERITTTGLTVSTPAYMSPEQASGERALDQRSDVYSAACVLYEMLAGVPPFTGPTPQAVIAQRFAHGPPAITRYRTSVGSRLQRAIEQVMAITPADRPPTMEAFVAALVGPPAPESRVAATGGALFHLASLRLAPLRQVGDTTNGRGPDPAWISCLDGCCTANPGFGP